MAACWRVTALPVAWQINKLDKAVAAANTFFLANPDHVEMKQNLDYYKMMAGVREEDFKDLEARPHMVWTTPPSAAISHWEKENQVFSLIISKGVVSYLCPCNVCCYTPPGVLPSSSASSSLFQHSYQGKLLSLALDSCWFSPITPFQKSKLKSKLAVVSIPKYVHNITGIKIVFVSNPGCNR